MSLELTEKLLKAFVNTGDMHMSYRELAVISAKEIEGLLADEREKMREMCAVEILKRAGELRDFLKAVEESCGPGDVDAETERLRMENRAEELELVAAGIRQLDLTKLDEGKG